MPEKVLGPVARANRLAKISIRLTGPALRQHRAWERGVHELGGPRQRFLEFATWYPAVKQAWAAEAVSSGHWEVAEDDSVTVRSTSCKASEPDLVLAHICDATGLTLHLVAQPDGRGVAVQAQFCRRGWPPPPPAIWTEDQRLTYEELTFGQPCKVCGRALLDQADPAASPAELKQLEEAFEADHRDCRTYRWGVAGGSLVHCGRCCPPPPFSPEQMEAVTAALAPLLLDVATRQVQLEAEWKSPRP